MRPTNVHFFKRARRYLLRLGRSHRTSVWKSWNFVWREEGEEVALTVTYYAVRDRLLLRC